MHEQVVPASSPIDAFIRPWLDWQSALVEGMVQAQQGQLQAIADWQRSIGALDQDWVDWWACRFGGGVPLDG